MAIRVPWDKQETVILIDAYLKVKNREITQAEAVRQVSLTLRYRATLLGLEIDNIFRNENGVRMQMKIIGGLIEGKPSGLHSTTKIFNDMVALYKTNQLEYERILLQVKGECVMSQNTQDKFFTWLSERVPTQLAEIYIMCRDIESFCINEKILTTSLFEITDITIIKQIEEAIQSKHFRQLSKMKKVISLYINFIKELSNEKEVTMVVGKTREISPIKKESIKENTVEVFPVTSTASKTNTKKPLLDLVKEKTAKDIISWNFANPDLEFKSIYPQSVVYFGSEIMCEGWEPTYVNIIKCLLEDYPSIIRGLVGYRFTFNRKVILTGRAGLNLFEKTVDLYNGIYLNIDLDPYEMITVIRILMDKCNMDYDNIVVRYTFVKEDNYAKLNKAENKDIFNSKAEFERWNSSMKEDEVKENRKAFIAWAQSQDMAITTILAYLSNLKKCSAFAKEHNYIIEEDIFLIKDRNRIASILSEMEQNADFITLDKQHSKQLNSAMQKLITFCHVTYGDAEHAAPILSSFKETNGTIKDCIDTETKERYTKVLQENFEDGFRIGKTIDRKRFRMFYLDQFGFEIMEDDEKLISNLLKIGTLRDERVFVKDVSEQKDLIKEINDTIIDTFDKGASCIYLDCVFAKFQKSLAEMLHIYNVDSFESILFSGGKKLYFKKYNFLFTYKRQPEPSVDIVNYMKNANFPVSYSELEKNLWYIPLNKIKTVLVTTPEIVNVASESYLYAANLPVSDSEIQTIAELIHTTLFQRSYISDAELIQLIEQHCPSVLMNTSEYPAWGLRNALAYILKDRFSFCGAIISDKGEEISMARVFADFCKRNERITVDELKNFAKELNTVIYWDSVYEEAIRISQNEFVRKDSIRFDIEQIDFILDKLILGAYLPIKEINLFLHFPAINVKWNGFVLESYVSNYSKKFQLLHASFSATDYYGAVVRKDSNISDYRTLIVDVLTHNSSWKNKKEALQLLVEQGYQQRRNYSDIENVMKEAISRITMNKT